MKTTGDDMTQKTQFLNANPARVDIVLFTLKNDALQVALFKRDREPYLGSFALPGGFVHEETDDTLLDAAARVLREKTGLQGVYLEELCTFSGKNRDPRRWSMTVAHFAMVNSDQLGSISESFCKGYCLVPVDQLGLLPFDHRQIVDKAVQRIQSKGAYSTLPFFLCAETFSLPEIQNAYEMVTGSKIKSSENFRRKLIEMDVLEKVQEAKAQSAGGRRAQLYKLKSATPALLNRSRGLI